jgi:hypothetical protein
MYLYAYLNLPFPELEARIPPDANSSNTANLHFGHILLAFELLDQLDLDPWQPTKIKNKIKNTVSAKCSYITFL